MKNCTVKIFGSFMMCLVTALTRGLLVGKLLKHYICYIMLMLVCSRLPHRTPDRLLKRFVCAGWHTFATYRSANVAARPFGSQLGKCFDNRSARLFASIVCLELIGYRSARLFASIVCLELIGYCLWLWLNQSDCLLCV